MDNENKRIEINDLPTSTEELTDEEAKSVQGGTTKIDWGRPTVQNSTISGNTASAPNELDPNLKAADGSV